MSDCPIEFKGIFHEDERGSLHKAFGMGSNFIPLDVYVSKSKLGVFRGLHYQKKPFEQKKVFKVVNGKINLSCVRVSDMTECYKFKLTANSQTSVLVPAGYATGFFSAEDNTTVLCLASERYSPSHEASIAYNNISELRNYNFIVSSKDDPNLVMK